MSMDSVSKHSKAKVEVFLDNDVFKAGQALTGRLQLTCTTDHKLRLGEMAVELVGLEGETRH